MVDIVIRDREELERELDNLRLWLADIPSEQQIESAHERVQELVFLLGIDKYGSKQCP